MVDFIIDFITNSAAMPMRLSAKDRMFITVCFQGFSPEIRHGKDNFPVLNGKAKKTNDKTQAYKIPFRLVVII